MTDIAIEVQKTRKIHPLLSTVVLKPNYTLLLKYRTWHNFYLISEVLSSTLDLLKNCAGSSIGIHEYIRTLLIGTEAQEHTC